MTIATKADLLDEVADALKLRFGACGLRLWLRTGKSGCTKNGQNNSEHDREQLPCRKHSSVSLVGSPSHADSPFLRAELLRAYRCGVVLSEQARASGEMPDAIGWKRACHSVVGECKATRPDFLADRSKPFRHKPEIALGCERFYLAPAGLIGREELPQGWVCWNIGSQNRDGASVR